MDIARRHRYQPDLNARGLASGRTMTIGVVLFDLYNRSFAQLANAIESRARERGCVMHLTLTGQDRELELGCIRQLVQRKVDGIILFSVNEGAEFEEELSSLGTPVVTVCNYISSSELGPWTGRYRQFLEMRCNCRYAETWTLSGREDTFEPFENMVFRYVVMIGPDEAIRPDSFAAVVRHYPLDENACRFESADSMLFKKANRDFALSAPICQGRWPLTVRRSMSTS